MRYDAYLKMILSKHHHKYHNKVDAPALRQHELRIK
jgi:hypothetical protein